MSITIFDVLDFNCVWVAMNYCQDYYVTVVVWTICHQVSWCLYSFEVLRSIYIILVFYYFKSISNDLGCPYLWLLLSNLYLYKNICLSYVNIYLYV